MRIGLISDTHVPEAGKQLPGEVFDLLAGVDMVMHGGDMHIIDVLDWLERIAPVIGARGSTAMAMDFARLSPMTTRA